jgi:hypothetical protein
VVWNNLQRLGKEIETEEFRRPASSGQSCFSIKTSTTRYRVPCYKYNVPKTNNGLSLDGLVMVSALCIVGGMPNNASQGIVIGGPT